MKQPHAISSFYKFWINILLFAFLNHHAFATDADVSQYGAVGDGKTLNSVAIQNAIDDCSKKGGGKVYFPAGRWLCGTILLKNGVVLSLDNDAVLLGSTNIADYFIVDGFTDGTGQAMGYCFIGAVDVKNVGIEGKGTVNGQGRELLTANGKTRRPFLVRFVRCENVSVKNIHLQASAAWTMHLFRTKNINVEGVNIYSRGLANNDGIDIDCCEEVSVKNCDITSDDDAICFKTTSPFPCRNITVSNIKARTNCSAVKFGTESTGDFQNIKISGIHVSYAGLGAIKIFSVDGSHVSNIDISGVDADTVNVAIMIRLGARLKTFRPEDKKKQPGTIDDIRISNVKVKRATLAGILFSGIQGHAMTRISLDNITIHLSGGGTEDDAKIKLAEAEAAYPETRMFGKVIPAYGCYIRHVQGLKLKNIILSTDTADARPALIAEDVKKIELIAWKLSVTATAQPVINFTAVHEATIRAFKLSEKPKLFLNVEDESSGSIKINKIKFVEGKEAVRLGKGVSEKAVVKKR